MKLKNYQKELKKLEQLKGIEDTNERKIKTMLQNTNIRYALFSDVIDAVCETLNKYKGKRAGEKTKEKICEEIEKKFNDEIFVYLTTSVSYSCDELYIVTRDETKKYSGRDKIRIRTRAIKDNIVNNENIIQETSKEMFCEEIARTYTKNLDKTTKEIIEAHKKARECQIKINELYHNIKELSNYQLKCIEYTSSVSNWVI